MMKLAKLLILAGLSFVSLQALADSQVDPTSVICGYGETTKLAVENLNSTLAKQRPGAQISKPEFTANSLENGYSQPMVCVSLVP